MTKFQDHIGLDIGTTSIKLVQVVSDKNQRFKMVKLGLVESPKVEGQEQWAAVFGETIKKLLKDVQVLSRRVVISLPESQVYTRIVDMPYLEEPELSQAISWQAEQYIPVPLSEVTIRHEVISLPEPGVPGAKMTVLLVAAPNSVISKYSSLLSSLGLELIGIETEVLASIRALTTTVTELPQILLIRIGADMTSFTIYRKGNLSFIQSIGTGGVAITRSLVSELGLDLIQAREYKQQYGLDETKLDGKVAKAIKSILDFVVSEVKKVLGAYESRSGVERVKQVVLTGGGSILPGIVPYFASSLNLEAQMGDPFSGINLTPEQKQEIGQTGVMFDVAVGLAIKPT